VDGFGMFGALVTNHNFFNNIAGFPEDSLFASAVSSITEPLPA
jgi:hypothetical protein